MTEVESRAARDTKTVTVGVVAESGTDERHVTLLPDDLQIGAGATISDAWSAVVVVIVAAPTPYR